MFYLEPYMLENAKIHQEELYKAAERDRLFYNLKRRSKKRKRGECCTEVQGVGSAKLVTDAPATVPGEGTIPA